MDIVTLPVGLVIGLFPVIVDMGGQTGSAHLLLDAQPVCEVRADSPSCMVDLGSLPRIHTLDLERLDEQGCVVEHVRRYLNRGFSGDVKAVGGCDEARGVCDFELAWSHPARSEPVSITAAVDGRTVPLERSHLRFPSPRSLPAQVLTLEARFADGGRAQFTRLLHGSYPEETEARLQHVELEVDAGRGREDVDSELRSRKWRLRTVEQGDTEVLFVLEPRAMRSLAKIPAAVGSRASPNERGFGGIGLVRFLVARESLAILDSPGAGDPAWRRAIIDLASRSDASRVRVVDAVAVGGFHLGASARRRILVLVLADGASEAANPDTSFFSREGALAYLHDAHVPLVVWRTGDGPDSGWPGEERIATVQDLDLAVANLRARIDRQWLAWVEGDAGTTSNAALPSGWNVAGPDLPTRIPYAGVDAPLSPPENSPSPTGDVYGLASDGHGALIAATANGLFFTKDGGRTWTKAKLPDSSPVFSVAIGFGEDEVFAGTGRALMRGRLGTGEWSFAPLPTVQALAVSPRVDSAGIRALYAGVRGNLFRSVDGGRRWTSGGTGIDAAYAVSLAVDRRNPDVVYAGTMGSGIFESRNRGASWKSTSHELQDAGIRCLLADPRTEGRILAGTEGGLFVRSSERSGWTGVSGFPQTIVYALAACGADPEVLFAGTETGLFESHDRGATWIRNGAIPPTTVVTSLAETGGALFAGTLTSGVVRIPLAQSGGVR